MKIKNVVEKLLKYDQDKDIIVFADSKLYPILDITMFEGEIEIDCGYDEIKESE
jgi:hypothetical protein